MQSALQIIVLPTAGDVLPTFYRVSKRIQRRILPRLLRALQQEDFCVVGFGEPPLKT